MRQRRERRKRDVQGQPESPQQAAQSEPGPAQSQAGPAQFQPGYSQPSQPADSTQPDLKLPASYPSPGDQPWPGPGSSARGISQEPKTVARFQPGPPGQSQADLGAQAQPAHPVWPASADWQPREAFQPRDAFQPREAFQPSPRYAAPGTPQPGTPQPGTFQSGTFQSGTSQSATSQPAGAIPPPGTQPQPVFAARVAAVPSLTVQQQQPVGGPQPAQALALPKPQEPQPTRRKRRRRVITTVIVVVVLILGLAAAGGGYLLLRTRGTPRQTAVSYLSAWQRGQYAAMAKVSVNVPSTGLAVPIQSAATELGVRSTRLSLGAVTTNGGSGLARFTVTDDLASGHVWTYQGQLQLIKQNHRWWVNWSPSAIYPGLHAGERFALTSAWPARANILAAGGTVLSSPATIAQSESLALLTGYIGRATAKQAKALGAPYRAGDLIGIGGIEQAYQSQLAGRPSLTIQVVGPGKHLDATAEKFAAVPGKPVRTSIEMSVQLAAAHAIVTAKTNKPVDMVVIQPSTGHVLAVVERPGGFDRALEGIFPPGSTFKVITASALAKRGMTPASPVQCPATVTIDGRTIHNADNEHLGATNLQQAFAISCNTTFAELAVSRLNGRLLGAMARVYGFNATPSLGIPATLGSFSAPHSPIDLAADAFGQGTDLVNPLSQAAVAAAVESGTWRSPELVISPAPRVLAKPRKISATVLNTLRPMMRAVVTSGTAAGVGFPPGVYGKTGTAEYGTGPNPKSHGWFIGYRGDLAFAVIVEGGGFGADSAAPIANAFLRSVGP